MESLGPWIARAAQDPGQGGRMSSVA